MHHSSGDRPRPAVADVEDVDGWVVLRLHGEVDVASEPGLVGAADQVRAHPGPHLLVDLAATTFLDSSGVAALAGLLRSTRARAGHFVVLNAGPVVLRVLELTGLVDVADDPSVLPAQLAVGTTSTDAPPG